MSLPKILCKWIYIIHTDPRMQISVRHRVILQAESCILLYYRRYYYYMLLLILLLLLLLLLEARFTYKGE